MSTARDQRATRSPWLRLLVSDETGRTGEDSGGRAVQASRWFAFGAFHLLALAALWTGISVVAVAVAVLLYAARMFFITGFYHRYFSHKAFRASRPVQFAMAAAGCTAGQRGPLWWAGHHRHHHAHADDADDPHSPAQQGLFTAHMGWFLRDENYATPWKYVRDWARYPELRWLNRYDMVPFLALAAAVYGLGGALAHFAPGLGTDGPQMLVVGFIWSSIALYHATYTINSLAHRWGSRRYATGDDSRNNGVLALITLGEGWHNNHHFYPGSARQGFRWWELDATYYGLRLMAAMGLIRDLRPVPASVLEAGYKGVRS